MHALRAQTDKIEYAKEMRRILEDTPNLFLREGMAVGLDLGPNDEVQGVKTFFGLSFRCRAAVVTTGTFMNGRIWVGRQSMPAGRYPIHALCDELFFILVGQKANKFAIPSLPLCSYCSNKRVDHH